MPLLHSLYGSSCLRITSMLTVALCGNSLLLSSIGASLQRRSELRVLACGQSDVAGTLRADSDVVIFDLANTALESAVALWKKRSNVLFIGVDLTTDQAVVLCGERSPVLTQRDLLQVIESHFPGGMGGKP